MMIKIALLSLFMLAFDYINENEELNILLPVSWLVAWIVWNLKSSELQLREKSELTVFNALSLAYSTSIAIWGIGSDTLWIQASLPISILIFSSATYLVDPNLVDGLQPLSYKNIRLQILIVFAIPSLIITIMYSTITLFNLIQIFVIEFIVSMVLAVFMESKKKP